MHAIRCIRCHYMTSMMLMLQKSSSSCSKALQVHTVVPVDPASGLQPRYLNLPELQLIFILEYPRISLDIQKQDFHIWRWFSHDFICMHTSPMHKTSYPVVKSGKTMWWPFTFSTRYVAIHTSISYILEHPALNFELCFSN